MAAETRTELGIGSLDRIDPRALADWLGIPIWNLSGMQEAAPAVSHLLVVEPEAFSAVTVFAGPRRTIVHNDGHHPVRQNSNLAHELSHALLRHPPTPALDDSGCRIWDPDIEEEATWMAGCLLMTPEAALATARGQWSVAAAAARLGISEQMVNFRINKTGARTRVQRARAARS
jgi:Zn-dependent peptidase ImmA (M78 family)